MHIDRSSVPYLVDEISTIESDTFYIPFCPGNQLYLLEGRVFDFYCLFFHSNFSINDLCSGVLYSIDDTMPYFSRFFSEDTRSFSRASSGDAAEHDIE